MVEAVRNVGKKEVGAHLNEKGRRSGRNFAVHMSTRNGGKRRKGFKTLTGEQSREESLGLEVCVGSLSGKNLQVNLKYAL